MSSKEIEFFNRYTGQIEREKVYGDTFVRLMYDSSLKKVFAPLAKSSFVSKLYGETQDTAHSAKKIPSFVRQFNIDLNDYQGGSFPGRHKEKSYKSFNEFFIRKFVDGKRSFPEDSKQMGAFAEARYFGHNELTNEVSLPVKGTYLNPKALAGDVVHSGNFEGGPFLIARLCPVDYHRYHYPDSGRNLKSYPIHGEFHSVNPLALARKQDILIQNERRVSLLQTENFGKLIYIEVGAMMVGKIVQTHNEQNEFRRGDQKGYFLFGGSTVVVLGEKGVFTLASDIIENTMKNRETYVHLGDTLAYKT